MSTQLTHQDISVDLVTDTSMDVLILVNNFNTSTYKFIAPVTGIYYFFTNIRLDNIVLDI